jgi:hypothetical protein
MSHLGKKKKCQKDRNKIHVCLFLIMQECKIEMKKKKHVQLVNKRSHLQKKSVTKTEIRFKMIFF